MNGKQYDSVFYTEESSFHKMKGKEQKSRELVKVPESVLLSLVVSKLKDRVLFPKKVEDAKRYLQGLKTSNP